LPSRPALWILDSSILIAYLRFGKYREFLSAGLKRETIFVPGVVLCELYAGATSREDHADLEVLRRALGNHLLEGSAEDWVLAGRCLSFYARRWGKIRPRDHLVDSLVAVSALQIDAILASEDLHQLRRWSWVLGKLGRRLKVTSIVKR
jgi:predicted nucleic acid-binding protein